MKIGQMYYKEIDNDLVKIEVIDLTKNLVFFKHIIDTEEPVFPYDYSTKYRFLPKKEFKIYLKDYDTTTSWGKQ